MSCWISIRNQPSCFCPTVLGFQVNQRHFNIYIFLLLAVEPSELLWYMISDWKKHSSQQQERNVQGFTAKARFHRSCDWHPSPRMPVPRTSWTIKPRSMQLGCISSARRNSFKSSNLKIRRAGTLYDIKMCQIGQESRPHYSASRW